MPPEQAPRARATVLHCIPTMGGGGAERQLAYLVRELRRFGWNAHVAVVGRGPNWDRLVDSGAVVHELPLRSSYDWRALGAVRRVVREVRPDIIQAWLFQMEVLAGLSAVVTRTPWIFSERASALAYAPGPRNLVRRGMARLATAVVSNSAAGDAYWSDTIARRFVVPNGLPLAEIDATPCAVGDALPSPSGRPLVLFAGRFDEQKNIRTLLAAFDLVLGRHDVQIVCCGEGPLREEADAWARVRAADGQAMVRGYLPNLWAVMKSAAAVVSPSLFEGSPNVVLEAMACGVPLVVSDIPEHRELLDERSALLVRPLSATELAAAVEAVLCDPISARARAGIARDRATSYSLSAMAQRYDDVYREILAAGAGA